MGFSEWLVRTPLLDRMPRLRRFVIKHPIAAKLLAVYLVLRWVVVPAVVVLLVVLEGGWMK